MSKRPCDCDGRRRPEPTALMRCLRCGHYADFALSNIHGNAAVGDCDVCGPSSNWDRVVPDDDGREPPASERD